MDTSQFGNMKICFVITRVKNLIVLLEKKNVTVYKMVVAVVAEKRWKEKLEKHAKSLTCAEDKIFRYFLSNHGP